METKTITVRTVSNGFVVEADHPVDGVTEYVFPKYFQVMRFLKDFLKDEE